MAKKKAAKKSKKVVRKAKKAAPKKAAKKVAQKKSKAKKVAKVLGPKEVEGGILLGEVEDYFAHVNVIALTLKKPLAVGDTIRIKGHTTDITQKVESLQIDHKPVQTGAVKDGVGIRIIDRARRGDAVFKI
jgi:putative protease